MVKKKWGKKKSGVKKKVGVKKTGGKKKLVKIILKKSK